MNVGRDPEAGVSLVEVLVVLAIIGVMAGVTVLSLGGGGGAGAEAEALRLSSRLQLAADEALVTGVPRALAWDAEGYRFLRWDAGEGEWRPEARPLLADAHALPSGLALEGPESADPMSITADRAVAQANFAISGAGASWVVAFDGLTSRAAPGGR